MEKNQNNSRAPPIGGRENDNNSLLIANAKVVWCQQQEDPSPKSGCFSKFVGEQPSIKLKREDANVPVTALAPQPNPLPLHLGDVSRLVSEKKILHRGPLKKRSSKLSLNSPSNPNSFASVSTPLASTLRPDLSRTQTTSSGFSSIGSLSSASTVFCRRLTPSVFKKTKAEGSDQLPVNRNLNCQLMAEPLFATPQTTYSTEERLPLSNRTLPLFNSRSTPTLTPAPFSFSKKRKSLDPVVTNAAKTNQSSDLVLKLPTSEATRGQGTQHASSHHVVNKKGDKIETRCRKPSSAINILRITHPFGNSPYVTKRSRNSTVYSPLAEIPNDSTKNDVKGAEAKILAVQDQNTPTKPDDTKIQKRSLFSPIVRHRGASFGAITSTKRQPLKSIIQNRVMSDNTKVPKSMNRMARNPILTRPELFRDVEVTTRPCKCKKSKCLKLYCECFHSGSFCDPNLCKCIDCMNNEANNCTDEPKGRRVLAMLVALTNRPYAFNGGRKFNTRGCSCKKSRYVHLSTLENQIKACFLNEIHGFSLFLLLSKTKAASTNSANALHREKNARKPAPV